MFKKMQFLFIFSILIIVGFFFNFSHAEAADRYWVGGTGAWTDDDNHWSSSSGGAPADGNIPTASDNCIFDTNSIAVDAAYTVTINTGTDATCNDFTMDGPGSGFNVTWASGGFPSLTISGSMNLIGGSTDITRTYSGSITFNATSGTKTITSNGINLPSTITFDGVGGTWQFTDAFSATSATLTLTNGSLDTNGQTVAVSSIHSSNSNTRSISLGSSTLTMGHSCIYFLTSTNLTLDAGTSTINCRGGNFRGGGKVFYNVVETDQSTTTISFYGENTFNNLTITGTQSEDVYLIFYDDQTINGVLTINGNSVLNRILVQDPYYNEEIGSTRTLTADSVSTSNTDFQDIIGAGDASWDLSGASGGAGDCLGNSGITFTTPTTRYWVGGTGSWSDTGMWASSTGGASGASVPLCHDDVVFDANSFSAPGDVVTAESTLGADITFAGNGAGGVTNNPLIYFISSTMYGSLTLVSGMQVGDDEEGAGELTLLGRSLETITFGGNTPYLHVIVGAVSGTYTMQDDFILTAEEGSTLSLKSGTFDANDFDVEVYTFEVLYSNTSNSRTLTMGDGTWELTGIDTIWDLEDNFTLNEETSTIKITNTSSDGRTFVGDDETYYNFWSDAGISEADLIIEGSNTFTDFKDTGTVAHNILFEQGTTQTVSTFDVSGTLGNLITLNSDNDSDTFSLVKSGGGTISSDYLNIQHSVATPVDTWYAGLNSVDNQLVAEVGSGWTFTEPPVVVAETPRSSSSGSIRRVALTQPVPILTPIPPMLTLGCLLGDKFSNMTGLPCPIVIEIPIPEIIPQNLPQNGEPNKFIFTKSLWAKMIDPEIKELQKYLNTHGYPVAPFGPGSPGNETEKFGNSTRDALIKFQIAHNINPPSGYFGPATRGVVNSN